mgnify:CR=1 FL=1
MMKAKTIKIQNFKCFRSVVIDNLSDQFNLFIGDNGEGKTTLLDALASVLDSFVSTLTNQPELNQQKLQEDWVRRVTQKLGEETKVESQYPLIIEYSGLIENENISWERSITDHNKNTKSKVVKPAEKLKSALEKGNEIDLPLIAYYRNNRLWKTKDQDNYNGTTNRLSGYINSLNAGRTITQLTGWLSHKFQEELKTEASSPILTVVKEAVSSCLDEWNNLQYRPGESSQGIVAISSSQQILPLHLLSDGYRNVLTIVADIAYRASLLNPHLGENAAKETSGMVLIDEIDLHLHPKWQEKVIADFSKTFPNIQFFATTHSPLIIQSLHNGKLIKLKAQSVNVSDDNEDTYEYIAADTYRDQSPEDILEEVMDKETPQKSKKYREMLEISKQYYELLDQAKESKNDENQETLKDIKEKLDKLSALYGDNPAYYGFLEHQRRATGIDN